MPHLGEISLLDTEHYQSLVHTEFLAWHQWALIFAECDPWIHQHTNLFCIGESKNFDHPFNVAALIDRYGLHASISFDLES